jgi:4-hydroxybenzoate polyprenyltransferase
MTALREALAALAFSAVWIAAAAGALAAAASRAMGLEPRAAVLGLVVAGTLAVYELDWLRDLDRDRGTAPRRSAFVERHRRSLGVAAALAGVVSLGFAAHLGADAVVVLAPALVLGLVHRRIKHVPYTKAGYLTAAWTLAVVGLPAVVGRRPAHVAMVTAIVGTSLLANAIAASARDREAGARRLGESVALRLGRLSAGVGVGLALLAPPGLRALGWIPAATLAALLGHRPGEWYGLVVLDGALLAGALLALPAAGVA